MAVERSSTIEALREISPAEQKQALLALLNEHPYRPPWWLRNQHLQTVWGPLFGTPPPVPAERQVWHTPDGDELSLYVHRGDPDKPWVLMLHGLEGCSRSFYLQRMTHDFHEIGWNAATMVFRSCDGNINKTKRIYHLGETTDLDFVVSELPERLGAERLYLAGMSLGANVLCKWLGLHGDDVPSMVRGAAALSPPFRPDVSIQQFEKALGGFYARRFLKTLIPKALAKAEQFPGCIDVEKIQACANFTIFDTEVTARLHGFRDADDYWEQSGCHQFLAGIRVPTMLLASTDDPFNPGETIPRETADQSDYLIPQWNDRGGHGAFVTGPWPWKPHYWMDEQVMRFFGALEHPS